MRCPLMRVCHLTMLGIHACNQGPDSWLFSWSWHTKRTSLHMLSDSHICRQKSWGIILIRYCNEWVQSLVARSKVWKDQLTSQGFCRSTEAMRKHGGLVNSALGFFPVSTPCSLKHVWVHIEQALNRGLISTLTIIFYTHSIIPKLQTCFGKKLQMVDGTLMCPVQLPMLHHPLGDTNNKQQALEPIVMFFK